MALTINGKTSSSCGTGSCDIGTTRVMASGGAERCDLDLLPTCKCFLSLPYPHQTSHAVAAWKVALNKLAQHARLALAVQMTSLPARCELNATYVKV